MRPVFALLVCLLLLLAPASVAVAQVATEVARTERLVYVATDGATPAARALAGKGEAVRDRIADALGRDYDGVTEIRVADSGRAFQMLQPDGWKAPSWAAGVAWSSRNLVVLNVAPRSGRQPPEQVLAHELSHIALGRLAPERLPRWFLEGMAVYHAGETDLGRIATIASAVARDDLLHLDELGLGWPQDPREVQLAYALSIDFVQWLFREHGREAVHRLVAEVVGGADFEAALETATGDPLWKLERSWVESLRVRYTWIPAITSTGFIWGLTSLLFVWAWWRRRRRRRAEMETLDDPELDSTEPAPDDLEPEPRVIPFPGEGPQAGSGGALH